MTDFKVSDPIASFGDINLQDADALVWGTDLKLFRDGPWELALRDGLNDNFFYIYGTFTDASNYERLAIYAGSSVNHFVEPQSAGTGSANINLNVRSLGTGNLVIGTITGPLNMLGQNSLNLTLGLNQVAGTYTITKQNQEQTGMVGATVTFSNIIPQNAIVHAVTVRVNTTITGATSFEIGDGSTANRFGTTIGLPAGTTTNIDDQTDAGPWYNNTGGPISVVLTANGSNFVTGAVRCFVVYSAVGAPTS